MSNLHLKSNPSLNDWQDYINDMMRERGFQDQPVSQACLLLVEEVGELLKCLRKSHAGMRMDVNKKYDLDPAGEVADILIVLTCIANQLNINLEEALRSKEEQNKQRTWQ